MFHAKDRTNAYNIVRYIVAISFLAAVWLAMSRDVYEDRLPIPSTVFTGTPLHTRAEPAVHAAVKT